MKQRIVVWAAFLFIAFHAVGSPVRFRMSGPDIVSVGDQFRLSFMMNAEGRDMRLPNLDAFDVLMGPSVSESEEDVDINGKTSRSVQVSYTYILRAKRVGKYGIRPATININGRTYQSNGIQVQVIKGSTAGHSQQQGGYDDQSQKSGFGKVGRNDLFIRMNIDKNNVYKGQHLLATLKIYTRVSLAGFDDVHFPPYTGFWSQEIQLPQQISLGREVVNGQVYNVGILKKTVLFPQQTGRLYIKPFDLECIVQQHSAPRGVFGNMFVNVRNVKVRVVSNSSVVNVRPLPNPPANFSGAIGSFQVNAYIDKKVIPANEAATLHVNVSGNGNLKLIQPLKMNFPSGIEAYDPKTNMNIHSGVSGVDGNISFDYLFVPRSEGQYVIPASLFTYFNPASGRYETRSVGPFTVKVTKGSGNAATLVGNYSQQDLKLLGQDIRYVKLETSLHTKGYSVFSTTWFYLLYLLALVVFVVLVVFNRKRAIENGNLELMKNRRAGKLARKHLKNAAIQMKTHNQELFYEAVLKAFWGYLSDKLSIPVSDLNRESAVEALKQAQIEEPLIKEFLDIVDKCEFARFAPAELTGAMENVYHSAEKVMNELDRQIDKK